MSEWQWLSSAFFAYVASSAVYGVLFFKDSALLKKSAFILLMAGFLLHSAALAVRWAASGHAPFSNMYESLVFFSWAFVLAFLIVDHFLHMYRLGFFITFFNLGLMAYAFSHDSTIKPLMPALQSNWMLLHVITCFLSYGAFAVSFLASIIYLTPLGKRYFSPLELDTVIYKSILFGFPLLILGVASGAVWANEAWGTYWSWDPKETWALITCFVYALYLHLRLINGWSGQKLAWVSFGSFLAVIFTYLGVSYLLSGLHSYA